MTHKPHAPRVKTTRGFVLAIGVIVLIALGLVAVLVSYISNATKPQSVSNAAALLNDEARDAGYPSVHFETRALGNSIIHDATASLGETTAEEFVNNFNYLHEVTSHEMDGQNWTGGLSGKVNGVDLYFDESMDPSYVDKVVSFSKLPFESVYMAEGVTTVRATECVSEKENREAYSRCADSVKTGLLRLISAVPEGEVMHSEVLVQVVRSTEERQAEIIHLDRPHTELPSAEEIAKEASVLTGVFFDTYALSGIERVSIDAVRHGNSHPRIHVYFPLANGTCELDRFGDTIARARTIVENASEEVPLNLRLSAKCVD